MARTPEGWMWAQACELLERAERLHRQFFRLALSARQPSWEPPADVVETEHELWVLVALPGVTPDDVRVAIEGSSLVVVGARRLPPVFRNGTLHRLEIPYGAFARTVELPSGQFQLEHQELSNGCLALGLRKVG